MAGIIAKKLEMTRIIHEGRFTPVTLVSVPKMEVAQVKTLEIDGYDMLVIRIIDEKREILKEVSRDGAMSDLKKGDAISIDILDGVAEIQIVGISKGKGFQGAMKRWNFAGGPKSHGSKFHRALGSIGTRKPRRTKPGRKMHGHMGLDQITLKKVPLVLVNKDLQILAIKGPVPGGRNSLLTLSF